MATLNPLPSLSTLPESDPRSPYYLPPPGYYQNDAGQVVPNSTPNIPVPISAPTFSSDPIGAINNTVSNAVQSTADKITGGLSIDSFLNTGNSLENIVFILVGLILIAGGVYALASSKAIPVFNSVSRHARLAQDLIA